MQMEAFYPQRQGILKSCCNISRTNAGKNAGPGANIRALGPASVAWVLANIGTAGLL